VPGGVANVENLRRDNMGKKPKLTPEIYARHYKQIGSKAGVARVLGMDERNLRRFVQRNQKEIDSLLKAGKDDNPAFSMPAKDSGPDVHQQVLKALNKEIALSALSDSFKVSQRVMQAYIDDLIEQGYSIENRDGILHLCRTVVLQENIHDEPWSGNKIIRFGVVSDKHFCSKYQQLTLLNKLYDTFEAEGIRTVYDPGDISDGFKMRAGHEHEIFVHGADDQADYIIKNHPYRKGIKTRFVLGNHDTSHIKTGGHDIGKAIAREREDLEYLGIYNAKINLTPNCTIEVNHPLDGACFDDKTEILTKDGWKLFSELNQSDFVATMTKSEHEFQWQQPTEITIQDYSGDMIHFKSRTVDLMVTPNHGLWVRRNPAQSNFKEHLIMPSKSHSKVDYNWKRVTAQEIYDNYCRQRWQFTNSCDKWKGKIENTEIKIPFIESKNKGMADKMHHYGAFFIDDFIEFIAWFVTEGYVGKKRLSICQSQRVNPENHAMIVNLLDRMGINYRIRGRDNKDFIIDSVELAQHIHNICGKGSREKHLPSFIKELPTSYLKKILDIMIRGDGWINNKGFGFKSISKQLRTDFMEMAVKCGYAVSEHKDTVNICSIQTKPTVNELPSTILYNGKVYCCKVPNELILVRRNGKSTWSHNSYALSYTIQKLIDSMSGGEKPNILLNGHHHKSMYLFYRNIHAFECGTACAQTPWMKGKRIAAHVGGWIIEVHVDKEGTITRCKNEFIPFYRTIKDDYKNWI